jgi:hypothetical protein
MKQFSIWVLGFFLLSSGVIPLQAYMSHQRKVDDVWKEETLLEFDELILSWNSIRPFEGKYLFYVRVKIDSWSPWLLYATWGSDGQSGFFKATQDAPVRVYQDVLSVRGGEKATGFQIKIVAQDNALLNNIQSLHVYTNSDETEKSQSKSSYLLPVYLQVPGLSQMALNHKRSTALCSPTATAAVSRYLANNYNIDPVVFAQNSWDSGFDIFGNWVFNVAEASIQLGPQWDCWVDRLSGFDDIYEKLQEGTPVIVSVKGPLPGSAQPYSKGHLIAVIGYDPKEQKVICMDPAFSSDDQTHVCYALSDFIQAWNRRKRLAYIFKRNQTL